MALQASDDAVPAGGSERGARVLDLVSQGYTVSEAVRMLDRKTN